MKKILLAIVIGGVLTGFAPVHADSTIPPDPEPQICFEAINKFRNESRCSKLEWSDEIAADCQRWAEKLQALGRIRYPGGFFKKGKGIHGYAGENIAQSDSGSTAFRQWFESTAGHNEFMKRPDTTVGAVGRAGRYWVFRAEKDIETYQRKTKVQ